MKRLFLAVGIPEEAQHALAAQLDSSFSLNELPGDAVIPNNWHVTVRFLGDVSPYDQDRLMFELFDEPLGTQFTIGLGGLGAFPDPRSAFVLWTGISKGEDELRALTAEVEQRIVAAGLEANDRPYVPHLTLSRIRPKIDVWGWVESDPELKVSWSVKQLTLFESTFEDGVARYNPLEQIVLA